MDFKLKSFLLLLFLISSYLLFKYYELNKIIVINPYNFCQVKKPSFMVFIFKDRNATVEDKEGFIDKIYLYKKDLNNFHVECKEKYKIYKLKFGAILKTKNDSLDVEKSYEKLHGYMGIFDKNSCYYTNKNKKFVKCKK